MQWRRKEKAQHVSERQVTDLCMALNVAGDFRFDLILSLDHNCDPAVSRLRANREHLDHWLSEDTGMSQTETTGGDFLII